MKIRPVGTELFSADRQADILQLVVAFCNVADAPESCVTEEQWVKELRVQ